MKFYELNPNIPVNDSYNVVVRVSSVRTISGAPSSITITTPIFDVGLPWRVVVRGLPNSALLVWRASNDLPLPDYWDNPVGEYRYWQARMATTQQEVLLERIELVELAQKLVFEIPCSTRTLYVHHAQETFARGNAKGVVSIHRTPTNEGYGIDSERVLTVDW